MVLFYRKSLLVDKSFDDMLPYFRKDLVSEYIHCGAKQLTISLFSLTEKIRLAKEHWIHSHSVALAFYKNKKLAHRKPSVMFPIR